MIQSRQSYCLKKRVVFFGPPCTYTCWLKINKCMNINYNSDNSQKFTFRSPD